jgi:hypothetical protein
MVKGESDLSESENWNVAEKYVSLKIMKPLYECDVYFEIALYGSENLQESLLMNDDLKTQTRKQAFDRLITKLQMVIDNTHFALKDTNQRVFEKIEEKLKEVVKFKDGIILKSYNQVQKVYTETINDEHFNESIKTLREIKRDINTPLNDSDLIFRKGIEFDIDKIKKSLVEEG